MERYVGQQFATRSDELRAAIERAQSLPLDELPEDYAEELREAFAAAGETFDRMQAIQAAETAVLAAAPAILRRGRFRRRRNLIASSRTAHNATHFARKFATPHAHEFSSFIDARDHVVDQDLVIRNGQLILPGGPGIGLALDPRKLKKYRLDL
jgi:hypothetical protein